MAKSLIPSHKVLEPCSISWRPRFGTFSDISKCGFAGIYNSELATTRGVGRLCSLITLSIPTFSASESLQYTRNGVSILGTHFSSHLLSNPISCDVFNQVLKSMLPSDSKLYFPGDQSALLVAWRVSGISFAASSNPSGCSR